MFERVNNLMCGENCVKQITQELFGANFCKNNRFCIDNWLKSSSHFLSKSITDVFKQNKFGSSLRHYVLDKISGNDVKHSKFIWREIL